MTRILQAHDGKISKEKGYGQELPQQCSDTWVYGGYGRGVWTPLGKLANCRNQGSSSKNGDLHREEMQVLELQLPFYLFQQFLLTSCPFLLTILSSSPLVDWWLGGQGDTQTYGHIDNGRTNETQFYKMFTEEKRGQYIRSRPFNNVRMHFNVNNMRHNTVDNPLS